MPRAEALSDLEREPWLLTEARPQGVDLDFVQPAFKNEGAADWEALTPRHAEFPRERVDRMSIVGGVLERDRYRLLLLHRSGQFHRTHPRKDALRF
jgi:hypothetical protein